MKVLFICKGNAFRSQIAAAVYNKLTQSSDAVSAGTYVGAPDEPEDTPIEVINGSSAFVDMMREKGYELHGHCTHKLTRDMIEGVDTAVSMAEEPYVPDFLKRYPGVIFWDVPDVPADTPDAELRPAMEKTYARIQNLVQSFVDEKIYNHGRHRADQKTE